MKSTKALLKPSLNRIVIVGAGRVGQTLGRLLAESGYTIEAVVCRSTPRAQTARQFTRARRAVTQLNAELLKDSGIILITTPDAAIGAIAKALAKFPLLWKNRFVFHPSGALSSEVLHPCIGSEPVSVHCIPSKPSRPHGKP